MTRQTASGAVQAPHRGIRTQSEKEKFVLRLFDDLWERYRRRVCHVRVYEQVIARNGAAFVNDHIAFRTVALNAPADGVFALSRIFRALGYSPQACYEFPDKHMSSTHLAHPNPQFPKLFVTELKTWELSATGRRILRRVLSTRRPQVPDEALAGLHRIDENGAARNAILLTTLIRLFAGLPWNAPRRRDVLDLNAETQFGAWVLLNGCDVNHFTALVNSHGVPALDTMDKTVDALKQAGIPMKKKIEGAPGSILRQSSTESVVLPFTVRGKSHAEKLDWTYAYFEIAERGYTVDPQTGAKRRFEGFLGPQATHLFDMTRLR